MSYPPDRIREAISNSRKHAEIKKRKFTEAFEVMIALREMNLKDPSQRVNLEVRTPHRIRDSVSVIIFAEGDLATKAKALDLVVYDKKGMEQLSKNPKELRVMASKTDFFMCLAPLMPLAGKYFGKVLAPRGKMPKPIPPTTSLNDVIDTYYKTLTLRVKKNPSINLKIGTLNNTDDELVDNIHTILTSLIGSVKGPHQIKKVTIKTTMGPGILVKR